MMKEKILDWLKKPVSWIGGLVLIVILYIKYLRNKNAELESSVETAESKRVDAVLEQQQKDLKAQHDSEIAKLEAEKGRALTNEELNEYLKGL